MNSKDLQIYQFKVDEMHVFMSGETDTDFPTP